jgi:uncharacterized DUF497 family protein
MLYEWDEIKRRTNLVKHGVDFRDAIRIFDGPVFENINHHGGEERLVAIGSMEGIEIVLVYVMRGQRRRIISARRAHRNERQDYANHLKRADQGSDRL